MKTEPPDARDAQVRAAIRSHLATLRVPPADLAGIVARAERVDRPRRRPGWVVHAAAAAVAAVLCGTVTAVAVSRTEVHQELAPVFAPDRIPDFGRLAEPDAVWPEAVRRLPRTLPDGSPYRITDTTAGAELLVISAGREAGPLLFDPETQAVRRPATPAVTDGLSAPKVTAAVAAGDRVVWFVTGRRSGAAVREAWAAPLAGGAATRLGDLPASAVDAREVVLAGDAVIWEEGLPGGGKGDIVIKRLSLRDGRVGEVPGSRGYWLSTVPGWITSQYGGTPWGEPERSGTLVEVATGRRVTWRANDEMVASVYCGPSWCAGADVTGSAALQDLDGGGYADLRVVASFEPGLEGRLAVGRLRHGEVVWDRGTGRAARVEHQPKSRPDQDIPDPAFLSFGAPFKSVPVVVWWGADGEARMLDLKRLW